MSIAFVPFIKPHEKHMEHFTEWYAIQKVNHARGEGPDVIRYRTFYKALHRAQQSALDIAKNTEGVTHMLFTEDDHWGYPSNGLKVLLEADRDVIGCPSYFKHHPWNLMAMQKRDKSKTLLRRENILTPARGSGIQEVDLITWAFTLVKMSVFERMEEAGLRPFACWGDTPTDSYFCQYCADLGIPIHAYMDHIIPHGDLPPGARHKARNLHDKQHPEVVHTVLKNDYDQEYGILDHKPLSDFFLREVEDGHTADDTRPQGTRGYADVGADTGDIVYSDGSLRYRLGVPNGPVDAVSSNNGAPRVEVRPGAYQSRDLRGAGAALGDTGD